MNLGAILQTKRSERGLSQEKLAELVGVSRQAVSKWELGDAVPDTDKLIPLAKALGVTVDELQGNSPEEPETETPNTTSVSSGIQPETKPGWFATHWYWLGLIPAAWGVFQLLWLLVILLSLAGFTNVTNTVVTGSESFLG